MHDASLREVLLVCPQERDLRAIEAARLASRYRVRVLGDDLDLPGSRSPAEVLAEAAGLPANGVVATKDRAALLAAVIAGSRGLPSPTVEALFACQHKPTSRALQLAVVPEATPRFGLLNGAVPPFPPPLFVKPVVGRLSQNALRVDEPAQLPRPGANDRYAAAYRAVAGLAGLRAGDLRGFLAEEFLEGLEVTLEGYVRAGRVTVIGVTDSLKYPGTNSFERFEYPSRISPERSDELAGITVRLLPALGFDDGFFNVEFFVPDDGPAKVIEVNGRIASQFAPLVQALHGRSTYDALFALACGDEPGWVERRPDGVALSYVMRVFDDAHVEAVPGPEEGLEVLVRPGLRLSEQGTNDVSSYRLAILYEAGGTREEARTRARGRARRLGFRLRPVR